MKTFKQFILENEEAEIYFPGGVYISVKLSKDTEIAVREYQEKYLKGQNINESLHCTLIYSKKPHVDNIEAGEYTAVGTFQEFNLFGPKEDTLVVEINSQDLVRRNLELVEKYGFISDFDEYKSHVTLSYDIENIDLNSLPPMDFAFTFIDEIVEELELDWNGTGEDEDEVPDSSGTLAGKALKKMKDNEDKSEVSDEEEQDIKQKKDKK